VSTGTIYHHLDSLSRLIEQKSDKKYYLTDLGIHAYNSLKNNIETIISPEIRKKEFNSPLVKGLMFLTPKKFISFEKKDKIYVILFSIGILITGAVLCGLSGVYSFLLFFRDATENISELEPLYQVVLSFIFIINFIIYYIIIEGLSRLFYNKKENSFRLLLTFSIIFLPMVIYLGIHFIFLLTAVIQNSVFRLIDNILMIFFQLWSLWLLIYNLNQNKSLKFENGLAITFLLHYGGFTIILFTLI